MSGVVSCLRRSGHDNECIRVYAELNGKVPYP